MGVSVSDVCLCRMCVAGICVRAFGCVCGGHVCVCVCGGHVWVCVWVRRIVHVLCSLSVIVSRSDVCMCVCVCMCLQYIVHMLCSLSVGVSVSDVYMRMCGCLCMRHTVHVLLTICGCECE